MRILMNIFFIKINIKILTYFILYYNYNNFVMINFIIYFLRTLLIIIFLIKECKNDAYNVVWDVYSSYFLDYVYYYEIMRMLMYLILMVLYFVMRIIKRLIEIINFNNLKEKSQLYKNKNIK